MDYADGKWITWNGRHIFVKQGSSNIKAVGKIIKRNKANKPKKQEQISLFDKVQPKRQIKGYDKTAININNYKKQLLANIKEAKEVDDTEVINIYKKAYNNQNTPTYTLNNIGKVQIKKRVDTPMVKRKIAELDNKIESEKHRVNKILANTPQDRKRVVGAKEWQTYNDLKNNRTNTINNYRKTEVYPKSKRKWK